MRQEPTDAEALLWRELRGKRMGVKFRRQHPVAGFIVDFYCPAARLAIELDGGGHTEEKQSHYDERRDKALRQLGIRVLRLWNPEVIKAPDVVLELISACVDGEEVPAYRGCVEVL